MLEQRGKSHIWVLSQWMMWCHSRLPSLHLRFSEQSLSFFLHLAQWRMNSNHCCDFLAGPADLTLAFALIVAGWSTRPERPVERSERQCHLSTTSGERPQVPPDLLRALRALPYRGTDAKNNGPLLLPYRMG